MNARLISAESCLQHLALLSWKGALLALALGAVLLLLRRHVSPAWRHGLWLLVLLRFAMPDIGTSSFSLNQVAELPVLRLTFSPGVELAVLEGSAAAALPSSVPAGVVTEAVTERLTEPPRAVAAGMQMPAVAAASGAADDEASMAAVVEAWSLSQWLFVLWGVGVGGVLAVMLTLHLRLLTRVRRDAEAAPAVLLGLLQEACDLAGISHRPELIVTDAVRTPALFGVLKPAILLPRELVKENDSAALKLVFLHELAHLGRRDLWAQAVTSVILALHWFNPVVWWAARRMRAEAELAADARALAFTDAAEAHRFGTVLLGLASRATAGWMVWLAAATVIGISESKHDLRRRIEALKDIAKGRRTRWIVGLAAFLLLAVTGLTKAPAQTQAEAGGKSPEAAPLAKVITVSGIVVNEEGKPVPGARCALSLQQSFDFKMMNEVSDAEGRFEFVRVPVVASMSLSASHKDYAKTGRVDFNGLSEVKEHRLVMPSFTWVVGRVRDKASGKPIANARVFYGREVHDVLGSYQWTFPSVRTGEDGAYRLPIKTTDTKGLILRAWAQGMASRSVVMDLDQKEMRYDVALEPAVSLPGQVVNAEGQPVKDAFVWVIEDRLVLDERQVQLSAEFLKSKDMRQNLAEGKMFVSLGYSGADGTFRLHEVDALLKGRQWMAAIHPEEGIAFLPAKEMTAGMVVKLKRWASLSGVIKQADGSLFGGRHASLSAGQSTVAAMPDLPPALRHYVPCSTEADGRYKVARILPHSWLIGVSASDDFHGVEGFRIGEGSAPERDILLRAPLLKRAPAGGRMVRGRLVLPGGRAYTSEEYLISPTLRPDEGRISGLVIKPDAEGRFVVDSVPPGMYTFSVMVMPRKPGLLMNLQGQIHLRFKLEAGAEAKLYELPDIVLEESDFVFEPIGARAYEMAAEGGYQVGETGRVEVVAVDHAQKPVAGVRIRAVDFADQGRLPLKLKAAAEHLPEVVTDAQGCGVLTFPRGPAPGVRAAGLMVEVTGPDGAVSREAVAMDGARTRVGLRETLPLEVTVSPKIEGWTVASWMDMTAESPAVGGERLSGTMLMTRSSSVLIRGRQADGEVLFSSAYKIPEEEGRPLRAAIHLTPAVTVEGQISPVSAGQKLDGWVAIAVTVNGDSELGVARRGFPPISIWNAWAPVQADGGFVFKDIPRGRLSVYAMGQGWQCMAYNPTLTAGTDATRLKLALNAQAELEQRVKILLPDGTPVKAATLVKSTVAGYSILSSVVTAGIKHGVAPEDAAAYASFQKAPIPGLRLQTDAEGETTLSHQIPGRTGYDVYWLDARTGQPQRSRFDLAPTGETALQTVTLKEVKP